MDLMKWAKKATEAALELSTGEFDIGVAQNVPPVALGPNASPLEEIARLAALPHARHGRAIVQNTTGIEERERGSSAIIDRTAVTIILRLRLPDGGFGPRSQHTVVVSRDASLLLTVGTEIPVLVDPTTGTLDDIDQKRLVEELRPRFGETRSTEHPGRRRGLRFVVDALAEAVGNLAHGDEREEEAVEGVTAQQWLLTRAALRRPVPDTVRDRVVQQYGVPAGRWEAVDAAWSARARTDPDLAARLSKLA